MITLITGAPGAGKSAALVSLLKELAPGRTIYVSGIPDLKIEHQPLEDPSKWHETVPDGSIIVIDEVQNVWRPKGPGQGVPPDIQALEVHRHRGIDFYIVTQSPRLVHTNVRALVGRHVHLRDVGFLGRYWYEWPECSENCSASWKQAPLKKRYKLPKAIFGEYKSASQHIKPIRSFPFMLVVAVAALLGTAGLSFYAYKLISGQVERSKQGAIPAPAAPPSAAGPGTSAAHSPAPAMPESTAFDQTVFIPVNPRYPESAPAYDHLRAVVSMPLVAGGVCGPRGCKCYSQQGTLVPMSSSDCRAVMDEDRFNPYLQAGGGAGVRAPVASVGEAVALPAPVPAPSPAPASVPVSGEPVFVKGGGKHAQAPPVHYAPNPATAEPMALPPAASIPVTTLAGVRHHFPSF